MSKLNAFLNPVSTELTKQVVVSKRFKDEKGQDAPFVIRTITQEQNDAIIKKSLKQQKNRGMVQEIVDDAKYRKKLVLACVVEPNFSSEEMCKAYGTLDPEEVPAKMLLSGEFALLVNEIMELNGFSDTAQEIEVDEAKNS